MYGVFSPEVRFQHTLESLESIKEKIPNSKILFIDNSNMPIKPEWVKIISSKVEVFHQMQHNLFSLCANITVNTKSESEANMLYTAFDLIKKHDMIGKRIFKISGRYKITKDFDILEYDHPAMDDKYTFVVTPMAASTDNFKTQKNTMWLEQALISFTSSNLEEFQNILFPAIGHMRRTGDCIEETLFFYIPHEKIFPLQRAYVTGLKAEGDGAVTY